MAVALGTESAVTTAAVTTAAVTTAAVTGDEDGGEGGGRHREGLVGHIRWFRSPRNAVKARPSRAGPEGGGLAGDFGKPKPPESGPKPRLPGQAEAGTSLCIFNSSDAHRSVLLQIQSQYVWLPWGTWVSALILLHVQTNPNSLRFAPADGEDWCMMPFRRKISKSTTTTWTTEPVAYVRIHQTATVEITAGRGLDLLQGLNFLGKRRTEPQTFADGRKWEWGGEGERREI
ncbi:hypothetical protein C8F04DRAFT_1198336 [Mycena alexandri]|uniref:Uncharacterized protein n=1 Tax=Mycena alexandri TaxID=1745969 RepID=A0AAD6S252_9AGAR|nr:hypothetical protein C8F04DRAFT_1198336 [Mycena alexandri]